MAGGEDGSAAAVGNRWFSMRDGLLVLQIALCAVLVTSSLVAIRGLIDRCIATWVLSHSTRW